MEDVIKQTNYIKIEDGCSQRCGYCAVRQFRGLPVSEPYQAIYDEVKFCVEERGMVVLQLEAVNSMDYQHKSVGDIVDLCKKLLIDFPSTYFMVGQVNPFNVIRFKRLMDLISAEPKMIKTCLVPIQSASNTALRRMHRPHTQEILRDVFGYMREKGVDYTIEIIPGFPGETEEEFMDTYNFLDEISPVAFYTHAFSPRPGTEAAELPDQLSEDVIVERCEKYKQLQKIILNRYKESVVGKDVKLIYDVGHGYRTIHNIPVTYKNNQNSYPEIIDAKIVKCENGVLMAE